MKVDFKKGNGLVPTIVQNTQTQQVVMLGYMNEEALNSTMETGNVTFYSRSKERLWMKGESSGNVMVVQEVRVDCDNDTLLIKANPTGPVCHTGDDTCFAETSPKGFLYQLEATISDRIESQSDDSYTNKMFRKGINKMAQKVGEEAVEVVIEAKDDNDKLFLDESADLLFHYLILLQAKGFKLNDIVEVLKKRH